MADRGDPGADQPASGTLYSGSLRGSAHMVDPTVLSREYRRLGSFQHGPGIGNDKNYLRGERGLFDGAYRVAQVSPAGRRGMLPFVLLPGVTLSHYFPSLQ